VGYEILLYSIAQKRPFNFLLQLSMAFMPISILVALYDCEVRNFKNWHLH